MGKHDQYARVKEVLLNIIDNMKSQYKHSLMLMDQCSQQSQLSEDQYHRIESNGEQFQEISLVGMGASCYNCRGQGRFARDCNIPKSKDKGGNGMQKGGYGQKDIF